MTLTGVFTPKRPKPLNGVQKTVILSTFGAQVHKILKSLELLRFKISDRHSGPCVGGPRRADLGARLQSCRGGFEVLYASVLGMAPTSPKALGVFW